MARHISEKELADLKALRAALEKNRQQTLRTIRHGYYVFGACIIFLVLTYIWTGIVY